MNSSPSSLALVAAIMFTAAAPVQGNPDPAAEIAILSRRIETAPEAALHLQRAALYRAAHAWIQAGADCESAARLAPGSSAVILEKSRLLFESGNPAGALPLLNALLQHSPEHPGALDLRSLVRESLGDKPGAVSDLSAAIRHSLPPLPDQFLRRAGLADDPATALTGLDEGIQRLGPLPALEARALALELQCGRTGDALARVDALITSAPSHLPWWKSKIEILNAAGDSAAADGARRTALAILDGLPSRRRSTAAMRSLRSELESGTP